MRGCDGWGRTSTRRVTTGRPTVERRRIESRASVRPSRSDISLRASSDFRAQIGRPGPDRTGARGFEAHCSAAELRGGDGGSRASSPAGCRSPSGDRQPRRSLKPAAYAAGWPRQLAFSSCLQKRKERESNPQGPRTHPFSRRDTAPMAVLPDGDPGRVPTSASPGKSRELSLELRSLENVVLRDDRPRMRPL